MRSIGLVFKKEEMIIVSLNQAVRETYLEGYRILPFMDFTEQEKEEAILHNLERFLKTFSGARDNLFIALPRDCVLFQFLNLPLTVEEDLRATLGYEMDRHTPFSFDEVYFDYQVMKRFPESNLLQVMLITLKKDVVDYYLTLFAKINLKPRGIEITTTALCNFSQQSTAPAQKPPDLSSITKHPLVKQYLTPYIAKLFPKQTQFLTTPKPDEHKPRIDILIEYLQNNYYELNVTDAEGLHFSKMYQGPDDGPVSHFQTVYKNGLKALIHLPYILSEETDITFMLSGKEMDKDTLEHIPEEMRPHFSVVQHLPVKIDVRNEPATPSSVLPLLSVPVGAALKGLKSVPVDINFIPPQQRLKKKRSKKKIAAVLFLGMCVGLSCSYIINSVNKTSTRLALLNQEVSELKQQVQSIVDLQLEAEAISAFSEGIEKIKKADVSKLTIVEELTNLIPEDSWLTDLKYKTTTKKVNISGYAVAASKLIPLLEESPLFENVKFTSPITTDKREKKEKFRIEMMVSPEETKA